MNRTSATESVDSGSIPGRVKSKIIKTDINSFSLREVQLCKG